MTFDPSDPCVLTCTIWVSVCSCSSARFFFWSSMTRWPILPSSSFNTPAHQHCTSTPQCNIAHQQPGTSTSHINTPAHQHCTINFKNCCSCIFTVQMPLQLPNQFLLKVFKKKTKRLKLCIALISFLVCLLLQLLRRKDFQKLKLTSFYTIKQIKILKSSCVVATQINWQFNVIKKG